jgi:O-antigen/teichoic acid export membrane protein
VRKDIFTYFIGKLVPAFVNLVLIILVVRFLGEDEYGKFSLISYFALLIVQLCFTWIQQSMIRFLTIYKDNPAEILSRFFFLTAISMVAGGVIVFFTGLLYFGLDAPELESLIRQAIMLEMAVGVSVSALFLLLSNFFYSRILHLNGSGLFLTSLFLIASAFLWQSALIFHKPLELLFRQKSMLFLITISLAVNLMLNLILVPRYGFRAAAITSLISVALYSFLNIIYSKILFRRHEEQNQNNPSRSLTEDLSEIGNF